MASRLFAQPMVKAQIKENIKAPRPWPLRGESTGDRGLGGNHSKKMSEQKAEMWRHSQALFLFIKNHWRLLFLKGAIDDK